MGSFLEVDLKDAWGHFEVDGEAVEGVAVPWGEVFQFVVVDEEFRGESVCPCFLALVEVLVAGSLVVVYGVAELAGEGGFVVSYGHVAHGGDHAEAGGVPAFGQAVVVA